MSGSVAEERIRAKVEALLRREHPTARIIHELMMEQGGCRIDLAAVMPDRIIVAEIKSERDVLDRLPEQVRAAAKVSNTVIVAVAAEKRDAVVHMSRQHLNEMEPVEGMPGVFRQKRNPDYVRELRWASIMSEGPDDGELRHAAGGYPWDRDRIINPQDLLAMLWASELRAVCFDLGVGRLATRPECIRLACEMLSGRDVRRRVCRQLLQRSFPRADEPREVAA